MNFSVTFYLNAGGLFDFDLTIAAEAILFIILALVVTFVFISPISKQLDERAEFINYTLRKSTILLNFGYETLSNCVGLLTDEVNELNRQIKLTKSSTDVSNLNATLPGTLVEAERTLGAVRSNTLPAVEGVLTNSSDFVGGLKRHWLFRGAFKTNVSSKR